MPPFHVKPRPGDLNNPDVTVPIEPPIRSHAGDRSPDRLRDVARGCDPASARHQPHETNGKPGVETHCDSYVAAVAAAMGTVLPEVWPGPDGFRELSANGTIDWLEKFGPGYEWAPVDAHQARAFADLGQVVIVGWRNPHGSGHVAIVLPSPADGPLHIAQAGKRCFFDEPIGNGFGNASPLLYFAHA